MAIRFTRQTRLPAWLAAFGATAISAAMATENASIKVEYKDMDANNALIFSAFINGEHGEEVGFDETRAMDILFNLDYMDKNVLLPPMEYEGYKNPANWVFDSADGVPETFDAGATPSITVWLKHKITDGTMKHQRHIKHVGAPEEVPDFSQVSNWTWSKDWATGYTTYTLVDSDWVEYVPPKFAGYTVSPAKAEAVTFANMPQVTLSPILPFFDPVMDLFTYAPDETFAILDIKLAEGEVHLTVGGLKAGQNYAIHGGETPDPRFFARVAEHEPVPSTALKDGPHTFKIAMPKVCGVVSKAYFFHAVREEE